MTTIAPPLTLAERYRELTYAQKRAIREYLTKAYDTTAGCYRPGVSDHIIGVDLNIPWSLIRYVRERDFGMV